MTLRDQLIRDEGEVLHLYYDGEGVPTIGIGCNLRDVRVPDRLARQITITPEASLALFEKRLAVAEAEITQALPWIAELDEPRRAVFVNMAYNLGVQGLLGFKKALAAAQAGDWFTAAAHFMDSKWAGQVGIRAERLTEQLRSGEWQ